MKLCFIIGNQRTGTNLLRDLLVSNDEFCLAGEVISPSPAPVCWYNYLARRGIGCQGPLAWDDASPLVDGWLADLQKSMLSTWDNGSVKSKDSWVGGDIKYNQLRAISPIYWELSEIPFILFYIMMRSGFVIHTRRRNTFKMILSAMIAEQSGVWHLKAPAAFAEKFQIDSSLCIQRMRSAKKEEEAFQRLSENMQTVECFYEDLAAGMAQAGGTTGPLAQIKAQLGVNGEFAVQSNFRKVVSQPYGEIISNFLQLIKDVSRTEFAGMAEEVRAEEGPGPKRHKAKGGKAAGASDRREAASPQD
jgi:LPS sulfotransferase NodH